LCGQPLLLCLRPRTQCLYQIASSHFAYFQTVVETVLAAVPAF
jgi:hypothetical protein